MLLSELIVILIDDGLHVIIRLGVQLMMSCHSHYPLVPDVFLFVCLFHFSTV